MSENLISTKRAGQRAGLSENKIRQLYETGELEGVRMGRSIKIVESSLERLMAAKSNRPAENFIRRPSRTELHEKRLKSNDAAYGWVRVHFWQGEVIGSALPGLIDDQAVRRDAFTALGTLRRTFEGKRQEERDFEERIHVIMSSVTTNPHVTETGGFGSILRYSPTEAPHIKEIERLRKLKPPTPHAIPAELADLWAEFSAFLFGWKKFYTTSMVAAHSRGGKVVNADLLAVFGELVRLFKERTPNRQAIKTALENLELVKGKINELAKEVA